MKGTSDLTNHPEQTQFWMQRRTMVCLIMIFLLAAGLRFWNVEHDSSLSRTFSGDARTKFLRAQALATEGEITTNRPANRYLLYRQPMFLVQSYAFIWKTANITGLNVSDARMREGFNAYMILFSLGTLLLVYFLSKSLSGNRVQALFAALLFAVFPVNVMGSLYVKEDIPLMFWFTAAMAAMILLLQSGRKKYYFLIGPLIGLAVATKYTGLLLLPVFVLVHVMTAFQVPKADRIKALLSWQILPMLGLGILAFLLFNPQAVTEWNAFRDGFMYQVSYAGSGHHDGTAIRGQDYSWMFYLRYAIVPGITFMVTVFLLAGLALAFVNRNSVAILIAITTVLVYYQFENSLAKPFPFFARYLHFIYPLMAVLAAYAFFELWNRIQGKPRGRVVGILVGSLLAITPLTKSILLAHGVRPDTRILAVEWINENLPSGSRIFMNSMSYSPHHLEWGKFEVEYDSDVYEKSAQNLIEEDVQYLVVSSFNYDRYRFSHEFTAEAKEAYEGYATFERELEPVKEFSPRYSFQSYGQHNPVIRIYKLPATLP